MKSLILAALLLPAVALAAAADDKLSAMVAGVESLGGYSVDFTIQLQGQDFKGNYSVKGGDYYINLADNQEFFGGDNSRCEVSHTLAQVVLDTPPREKKTLLDDPAHAFSSLVSGEYEPRCEGDDIILSPTSGGGAVIAIAVGRDGLPARLTYRAEGEQVVIELGKFKHLRGGVEVFHESKYPDYEIIDLR